MAYRNLLTLFRTVPSRTPYGISFPEIRGLQLSYPLLSQEQVKLRTSNLAGTFTGPIGIKAHYKFWKKGSVGVSGTAQIFWLTPIISGTDKVTDFKFCRNIHRVNPKKPMKNVGNSSRVRIIRESRKFSGHPCIGRIARSSLRQHSFLVCIV